MSNVTTIAKNTSVIFISQVLSYIIVFFTTIYSARYLGVEEFGILTLSIAFTGIFVIIADLGMSTLTVREVSRNKSLSNKYLVNFGLFKVFLAFLTFFLIFITVNLLYYSPIVKLAIYGMALSVILNSFAGFISSIFQAYEKMEYLSIGTIISSVFVFIGILAAIYYHLNVLGFVVAYIIANFILLIFYLIILVKRYFTPSWDVDLGFIKHNINIALPFGITGIFVMIYYWIDSIMLSVMIGNDAVGWYNAAYRLVLVLLFIPSVLNTAIFPAMSKFYLTSKESLKIAYERYFKYMAILGIPLGFGTTILAGKIIFIVFGSEYSNSIIALQILVWSAVIIFMSGAFARLLEASNKQMTIAKIAGICALINIILNLIFIPKLGLIGASLITVFTELLSFLFGLKIVATMKYSFPINFILLIKIIIASLVMSIFLILFFNSNLVILILIAALIYMIILISLKGLDEEDLKLIKNI